MPKQALRGLLATLLTLPALFLLLLLLHTTPRLSLPTPPARRIPPAKAPARTFLIVFMGHSGSSVITTELHQHPRILADRLEPVDHQPTFNTTAALATARALFHRGLSRAQIPGFKIRPAHILAQPAAWRALAAHFHTRIVWQYRRNIFKGSVGQYSYRFLGDDSVLEGLRVNMSLKERCTLGAGCSFPVRNMTFFHALLRDAVLMHSRITAAVRAIAGGRDEVLELPYEDYLYDRERTMAGLFRFLGVPSVKTEPKRFKATLDDMCRVVENWQQLCENFYGCILWQHMMEDERHGCYCDGFTTGKTEFCTL